MKEKISIIVPCYNEEECINTFYTEINKVSKKMKEVDFEFLFIDDGSKDRSLEIMKELSKKDSRVRFLSFSRNFGKEAGMLGGLENVTGDYAAFMDVDLQDPPEMLIEMYDSIKNEGYDCVALYTNSHKDYSFLRRTLTNMWYKLIDRISSTHEVPGARDFRLMKRRMVDSILSMHEYNRYIKGIFSFVGFKTKWIAYDAPERKEGVSKYPLIKLFKYAIEGIVAFSTKPLIVSITIGTILSMTGFIALIVLLIIKKLTLLSSLLCLVTFIGGLLLFFMGILGLYISKIYLEVKNRPVYIVRETEKDM